LLCPDQEFEELAARANASTRKIDYIPLVEVEGIDFEVHPKAFVRSPSDEGTNPGRATSDKSVSKAGEGHHQVTRVCWQE
jgi:hypothetical protein